MQIKKYIVDLEVADSASVLMSVSCFGIVKLDERNLENIQCVFNKMVKAIRAIECIK